MKIVPIDYKKLCKVFEKAGWVHIRTKGEHLVYSKDGCIRPIIIPAYKSIPVFIILNNLRTAGISRDEYLELLNSV